MPPIALSVADSPLRWAGSKRWLVRRLGEELRQDQGSGRLIDCFLGGGSVTLNGVADRVLGCDINGELVDFFIELAKSPEEVYKRYRMLPRGRLAYYEVRSLKPDNRRAAAARFLYLNRFCWGGLYRLNRRREFNVPYGREPKHELSLDSIRRVAEKLTHVELRIGGWKIAVSQSGDGDLVFADPPHLTGASSGGQGYQRYTWPAYGLTDHIDLIEGLEAAARRGASVVLCTDALLPRQLLPTGWHSIEVERFSCVGRSDGVSRRRTERISFSRPGTETAAALELLANAQSSGE